MRKGAVAAGTLAAVGLMAAGGTAFADSGAPAETSTDVQNTSAQATATDNGSQDEGKTVHMLPVERTGDANTQAGAEANRSVVGLAVPVNADLHEGVANDLNVQDVARDVVHLGKTDVPVNAANGVTAPVTAPVNAPVRAVTGGDTVAQANAESHNGTDAVAQANAVNGVGGALGDVVATATSTVNNVGNVVYLNGLGGGVQLAR